MNNIILLIAVSVISFFISYTITKFLIKYLTKFQLFDIPNERSSHKVKTPRGGGIAIIATIFIYIIANQYLKIETVFNKHVIISIILLVSISFIDDVKSLPSYLRFAVQIIAISIILYNIPQGKLLFGGYFNLYFDKLITLISLLWFVNLYNFMDGIDGISGAETIHIFLCVLALKYTDNNYNFSVDCCVIIFATLGFIIWNWNPAKIFLGDVGSITIGFIASIMLLDIAINKSLILALIIPLYYISDSTITICKRLIKGEKIWLAHNQHYYQKSVKSGRSHSKTVVYIISCNLIIFLNTIVFEKYKVYVIISSIIYVILLLYILQYRNLKTNDFD